MPAASPTNLKYKTEMCRSVFAKVVCKYGENCQFAHDPREIRNRPHNQKYKTVNCKNFHQNGYCYYGPKCDFRHSEPLPPGVVPTMQGDDDSTVPDSVPLTADSFMSIQQQQQLINSGNGIMDHVTLMNRVSFDSRSSAGSASELGLGLGLNFGAYGSTSLCLGNGGGVGHSSLTNGHFSANGHSMTSNGHSMVNNGCPAAIGNLSTRSGSDGDSPAPSDCDSLPATTATYSASRSPDLAWSSTSYTTNGIGSTSEDPFLMSPNSLLSGMTSPTSHTGSSCFNRAITPPHHFRALMQQSQQKSQQQQGSDFAFQFCIF